MKTYRVYLKDKRQLTVKGASIGKILEGMVVLHDANGCVVSCFTVSEIVGIVDLTTMEKE